eukprot:SAG22_NODE_5685_length_972_cov_0.910653_2_plen_135_part_01
MAAGCGRVEKKAFCTHLPPATPPGPPGFACEDGKCVPFLAGRFKEPNCGGRCAIYPFKPPYDATLRWPWYVASSSRMLGYTPPTHEPPPVIWGPFAPTPHWHAPSWPPPAAARYNVSLALQRGECEAVQLVVHAA